MTLARWSFLAVVVALMMGAAACSRPRAPHEPTVRPTTEERASGARPLDEGALRYDLAVSLDLEAHELAVDARVRSARPRSRMYLHPGLTIEDVHDEHGPISFQRHERVVDLDRPASSFEIRYRGRLPSDGTNDTKARAYLETGRVRLTEATLWYPVFYDGPESFPWPPEAAVGTVRLRGDASLRWAASGETTSATTFRFERPSSFTIVGVTTSPRRAAVLGGKLPVDTYGDAGPSFVSEIERFLEIHSNRLGPPHVSAVSVVMFPTPDSKNPLGFLTDSLVMLNTRFVQMLLAGEHDAVSGLAHEFAHLWFGADLRPSGAAALWLAEGFAEYYAWRALRDVQGAAAYAECVTRARNKLGSATPRLDALAVGDQRVYVAGPLALDDLAALVGENRLDGAIRAIHQDERAWTAEALMAALLTVGAEPGAVRRFRERWGI
jgi:hypothetical protein